MNTFIYGILLIFAVNLSNGNVVPRKNDKINMLNLTRNVNDDLKKFLEEFRDHMCYEIPNKGIPKLDPFGFEEFKLSIEQDIAQLDIEIRNLSASGLGKFKYPKLKFSTLLMKLELVLVVPKIELTTDYKVNGTIKDLFDLNGDGDIRLEVDNIQLELVLRFLYSLSKGFSLKINTLNPSIEKIKFRITKLFPDDELNDFVSNMVSDIGIDMINDLWLQYKEDVIAIIEALVTSQLEGLTPTDLLEMLGKGFFDEDDPKGCNFDDLLKVPQVLLIH